MIPRPLLGWHEVGTNPAGAACRRHAIVFVVMPSYRELLQHVKGAITEVDAAAARGLDGAVFLDVREQNEWHEGHIPGAFLLTRCRPDARVHPIQRLHARADGRHAPERNRSPWPLIMR